MYAQWIRQIIQLLLPEEAAICQKKMKTCIDTVRGSKYFSTCESTWTEYSLARARAFVCVFSLCTFLPL